MNEDLYLRTVAAAVEISDRHRQARNYLHELEVAAAVGAALLESDRTETRNQAAEELREVGRFLVLLMESLWARETQERERVIAEALQT